ncbi:MAG: TatD family hydrolase [Kiritimatiellia bacterium]
MEPLLFDTHCHFEGVPSDADELQFAQAENIRVIAVGGNAILNQTAEASGTAFAQGFDWSCKKLPETLKIAPAVCAIGELGFDFHYEQSDSVASIQRQNFEIQAEFARAHNLPIIVHTREADNITYEALRTLALPATGVIHSYTGGIAFARQLLDLGYLLSFSGIVTFRNADILREVVKFVPIESILVETDSPYLAPIPLRGQRNQPKNVRLTANFIAALRGISNESFAQQTSANACRLFILKKD